MTASAKKTLRNVLIYVGSALASVFVMWYILYHLFNGFESKLETTPAVLTSKEVTVSTSGYIIRNETPLYSAENGGVNYLYSDGEKVRAGSVVANIYSGDRAENITGQMINIDKQIEVLMQSSILDSSSSSDTNTLDAKINELYYVIRDKLEDGDLEYALYKRDELLVLLNKRQAITRNLNGYEDKIAVLKAEKESLSSGLESISEEISIDHSGYFYSSLDGYENIFTPSKLKDLDFYSYEKLIESSPEIVPKNGVGKIVNSDEWYVLAVVPSGNIKTFEVGGVCRVKFPYNEDVIINMSLEEIHTDGENGDVLLVLRTMVMPDGFKFVRKQTLEIIEESYSGYKIPSSSVRKVDGKDGVYVLNGNTVTFKQVEVLTEQDGYFIVKQQPSFYDDPEYSKKLGLYEKVIVSGKDLYDGKIINEG